MDCLILYYLYDKVKFDMTHWCLFAGIEQDAVRVYQKYLAQDATHPIGITAELRHETISK